MNTSMVISLVASFAIGGVIGGEIVHLTATTQVTCPMPGTGNPNDDGIAKLLQPKDIPTTGYKSY